MKKLAGSDGGIENLRATERRRKVMGVLHYVIVLLIALIFGAPRKRNQTR